MTTTHDDAWWDFVYELGKAQRNRIFYLDFSHVNNPGGIDWPDPTVRLYGKSPDARGPIPIVGSVLSFGTFALAVCNHEYDLEFPTTSIELVDVGNEWRSLAADPKYLLYRWAAMMLRITDDTGLILDQRQSYGQITRATFPPDKKVKLDLQLTGGKFLGEMIPRRLVTREDFPYVAPENVGKAVPIVWGVLSNLITTKDGAPIAPVAGCAPRANIIVQEAFNAGNSQAFNRNGLHWETGYVGAPFPPDPLYDHLVVAEGMMVQIDGGPNPGNNCLTGADPYAGYGGSNGASANDAYGAGAVVWRGMGTLSISGSSPNLWDATSVHVTFDMLHDYNALDLENFFYYPMITVRPDWGDEVAVTLVSEEYYDDEFEPPGRTTPGYQLEYTVWVSPTHPYTESRGVIVPVTYPDLTTGAFQQYTLCFQCGTYTYNPATDTEHVAADGWIKFYRGSTVIFNIENIALLLAYGAFEDPGLDNSNLGESLIFGYYGMAGKLTNISATAGMAGASLSETPSETPNCREEGDRGKSPNMVSGAMRALLVDTGRPPGIGGDFITPGFPINTSLPKVEGHEAHNVFGGGTIKKAVFFYVAVHKPDGTMGPISGIVDLDNAYDPNQEAHAASLSWWKEGAETEYVVWMTQDPNFHPVDRPTLGEPRTKVIREINHSQFPPINEGDPPFDYQVKFASLTDGQPYGGVPVDTGPYGYRYLLAGHALKAVDQVYVLKPVPTIVEGADMNTVTADAAKGATQVHVVWESETGEHESTVPRFSDGNILLFATEPNTPYEVTESREGVLTLVPPLGAAVTKGTAVYKSQDVDTHVLQVEGTDYEQQIVDINHNRYHLLAFYQKLQNPDTCAQYEVTANVQGSEMNADGTGDLIDHGISQFQHLCKNWIFNDYRSSVGDFAPDPPGKWFEDVPYAPGLIDNDSFYAANLVASGRVANSYHGAGALTEQVPASQLIKEYCESFGLDFYYQHGAWHVRLFEPGDVSRPTLPHYAPETTIIEETFEVEFDDSKHWNILPYFAGPMIGQARGVNVEQTGGFVISGELNDEASISVFGHRITEPLYMKWTRHAPTAYDVAVRSLLLARTPPVFARFSAPLSVLNDALASEVLVTHPDGLGPYGWIARCCRILRADINMDEMTVQLLLRDVNHLVP